MTDRAPGRDPGPCSLRGASVRLFLPIDRAQGSDVPVTRGMTSLLLAFPVIKARFKMLATVWADQLGTRKVRRFIL